MNFGSHGTFERNLIHKQSLCSRFQEAEGVRRREKLRDNDTYLSDPNLSSC